MNRLFLLAILILSSPAFAGPNDKISGIVIEVCTFTDNGRIYFKMTNQPTRHPTCSNTDSLSIDASVSSDIRHQILSRLLTAYATSKPTDIAYNGDGNCSHTRIRVNEVG